MSAGPPVLLTVGGYYGTLAAARCLGRAGVAVTVADPNLAALSSWSRFTAHRRRCPPVDAPERFIAWLLEFGRQGPRHVLFATSDDVAWLIARYRAELEPYFLLDAPPVSAMETLLSKRRLAAAATRVGLRSPETYFPSSEAELADVAQRAPLPLLIKPGTQVLLAAHTKGRRVDARSEVISAYREFQAKNPYPMMLRARLPECDWPMIQAYRTEAAEGIYSLSGYCPQEGAPVMLGARKVLQRPRQLGIGLCFEAAPARPELSTAVATLCREVGYHGVFEAEFIDTGDGALLIDFNPRFYSQMTFEIDRGLPLPLLGYLAASGDRAGLAAQLDQVRVEISRASQGIYVHRLVLEVMTRAQVLSGRMSSEDRQRWRAWLQQNAGQVSDAVVDADDPVPAVLDWAGTLYRYARHPRAFVRNFVLDR